MSTYVQVEEVKQTLELTGLTFADLDLQLAIAAATMGINEFTGRRFDADDDETSERQFTPYAANYLDIDDLVTCAAFQTDSTGDGVFDTTWTLNRDFVLEPLNAAANGKPYELVRVHPLGNLRFYSWPRSVQITGKFGWPTVPAPVKQATTIMAERLMRRARDAPFGVVALGFDQPGMQIPKLDPDVRFLLESYVKAGVLAK